MFGVVKMYLRSRQSHRISDILSLRCVQDEVDDDEDDEDFIPPSEIEGDGIDFGDDEDGDTGPAVSVSRRELQVTLPGQTMMSFLNKEGKEPPVSCSHCLQQQLARCS